MRKLNITITLILGSIGILGWLHVTFRTYVLGLFNPPLIYIVVPCVFSLLAAVGWVLIAIGEGRGDGETRCRKCGYILRGLSEPRCPECGEPV